MSKWGSLNLTKVCFQMNIIRLTGFITVPESVRSNGSLFVKNEPTRAPKLEA